MRLSFSGEYADFPIYSLGGGGTLHSYFKGEKRIDSTILSSLC